MQRKMSCPGDQHGSNSYPLSWRSNQLLVSYRQTKPTQGISLRDEEEFQLRVFFLYSCLGFFSPHSTFYDSCGTLTPLSLGSVLSLCLIRISLLAGKSSLS